MKKKVSPELLQAIARRLEWLMAAIGKKDAEMARLTGSSPQAWNNYTKGHRPLPIEKALILNHHTGVTLDWLYRGEELLMPHGLMTDINQASNGKSAIRH